MHFIRVIVVTIYTDFDTIRWLFLFFFRFRLCNYEIFQHLNYFRITLISRLPDFDELRRDEKRNKNKKHKFLCNAQMLYGFDHINLLN